MAMYKYLLGWRYLRTRWIALASIVSVTLGVATLIVVNSVMAGFTHEMMERMHGILADVIFEGPGLNGFSDAQKHMEQIHRVAGDYIDGMTPVVTVPAMLTYDFRGHQFNRQILLIGIDEATHASVSDFAKYLQHPENRQKLSFLLQEGGYDAVDHQSPDNAVPRPDLGRAGWGYRRLWGERKKAMLRIQAAEQAIRDEQRRQVNAAAGAPVNGATTTGAIAGSDVRDPFASRRPPPTENVFDETAEQHVGVIIGKGLVSQYLPSEQADRFLVIPGDDVQITVPTAPVPGSEPKGASRVFTVVDVYESKMSEYDSQFVFMPLSELQDMRGMNDPQTGIGNITSIQIKLKNEADGEIVRDKLRAAFRTENGIYGIYTWQDKQSSLLTAVALEKSILNILLFLIIAVAGFGILAIFYMIVVEKTRDIGVLKSLGASRAGVMGIFLSYGLSLGTVGAGAGLGLGLLFVRYINEIRDALESLTGTKVFDPSIYYFFKIPTIVEPLTAGWVVLGSIAIAVLASVLPARRAARLHPVEALRYE
jgi:lipoprotein-releasing system permease protein